MQIPFTVVCFWLFMIRASTAQVFNGASSERRADSDPRLTNIFRLSLGLLTEDSSLLGNDKGLRDNIGPFYKRGVALDSILRVLDRIEKAARQTNYVRDVLEDLTKVAQGLPEQRSLSGGANFPGRK